MICVAADHYHIIEFPEKSHFICVKREPCINSLFDDSSSWICTEVFVMKERICKLLTVKSIVTIILTVLFAVLAVKGNVPQEVMTIFTTVIAFYFGTQATKE